MIKPNTNKTRINLDKILEPFSENQLRVIFRNIGALELTTGCSVGCDFCGFEAKRGVKESLDWKDIVSLTERFSQELKVSRPFLYYATDPLDWRDEVHTYHHVNDLFEDKVGYKPYISTAVPRGSEELMHDLLLAGKVERVSISYMNSNRLKKFFEEKYPKLKDKEFQVEELPNKARKVHFTYELNKHGEKAWLELLADLACDREQRDYIANNGIRIRNLGSKHIGDLDPIGIACFHGTFLGKDGLYNQETTLTSREHPQGLIMTPLNQDYFIAYHLWRQPYFKFLNTVPDIELKKTFTAQPPLPELIRPIFARDVKEEIDIQKKQSLLDSYSFSLAILERYDCDFRRILDENPSNTITILEAAVRIREKLYKIKSDSLNPDEPYDSRLLHARKRYKEAQNKLRPGHNLVNVLSEFGQQH